MLTLTRRIGQRVFIGDLTVEVVAAEGGAVTLRVLGADETDVRLVVDEPTPTDYPTRRRRYAPPRQQEPPLIVEVRRSRKPSGG